MKDRNRSVLSPALKTRTTLASFNNDGNDPEAKEKLMSLVREQMKFSDLLGLYTKLIEIPSRPVPLKFFNFRMTFVTLSEDTKGMSKFL